ncbi:MAG: putative 3-methyladenine DNA glycosylase [Myxococcota bacterium]|nr:putative 3-methyladenine DNA glycosylase [Myxococcota bacterium]
MAFPSSETRAPEPLPHEFFVREVTLVARELLGCVLVHGPVAARITETEAYDWKDDSASHSRSGLTKRNAVMFGPAGRLYVFRCYGVHMMLNVVTGREGQGAAVLLRAGEIIAGHALASERRGGATGAQLASGPGRLARAMGLDLHWNGHSLDHHGKCRLVPGHPPERILMGARVGIDYAEPAHRARLWRFADAGSPSVTWRKRFRAG